MANLPRLMQAALAAAREHAHGRSAQLVAHDGQLRQTLIALVGGGQLGEHNSPPAATLYLLQGHIRVTGGDRIQADIREGELRVLTHERHGVTALVDSVFLLTTVTGLGSGSHA